MIYALIPEALCVLGLLVTMCPVVADELERGTWIHVAVRPGIAIYGLRPSWEIANPLVNELRAVLEWKTDAGNSCKA